MKLSCVRGRLHFGICAQHKRISCWQNTAGVFPPSPPNVQTFVAKTPNISQPQVDNYLQHAWQENDALSKFSAAVSPHRTGATTASAPPGVWQHLSAFRDQHQRRALQLGALVREAVVCASLACCPCCHRDLHLSYK